MKNEIWDDYYKLSRALEETLIANSGVINQVAEHLVDVFNKGNKLLICGNGGSAADSEHMAAEFVGRFGGQYMGVPAISLTNPAILTALVNDAGGDYIFDRQVSALGRQGDCLFTITTSGLSENILKAIYEAKRIGMSVITLSRKIPLPKVEEYSNYLIKCWSENTQRLQEVFLFIEHSIVQLVSEKINRGSYIQ